MSTDNLAPIIIKKKKVSGGDGHHGGAWKVAYADFVTAMMAFFLLMWLLNATSEEQRAGIADYFTPAIPLSDISGGGQSMFGGETVLSSKNRPKDGDSGSRADDRGDEDGGGEVKKRQNWIRIVEEPTPGEAALADARSEGVAEGRELGLAEGLAEGLAAGRAEGLAEGLEQGLEQGLEDGLEQGRAEGFAAAMAEIAAEAAARELAVEPTDAERAAEDEAAADASNADEADETAADPTDEAQDPAAAAERERRVAAARAEREKLAEIERAFNEIKSSGAGEGALEQVTMRLTPRGLVIEIADKAGEPLFGSASATPSPKLRELVEIIAPIVNGLENEVEIVGHTDAERFGAGSRYTNWDLSSDRANAARRVLLDLGVDRARIARVAGAADREPIADDPFAPQNRRIAITLLRAAPEPVAALTP